jgi:transposase
VWQFLERQPDRQAVDLLKYHLGWKFALQQELRSKVFDPTGLVRFRERLEANQKGRLAFETVLGGVREAGLVPKRGKQRLDSTHVLGMISRMSSLECVRESLRLALKELDKQLEVGQRPEFWRGWWERYRESQLDYKSPEATVQEKLQQAGQDLVQLKSWVATLPAQVQSGDKVQLLERGFDENCQRAEDGGGRAQAGGGGSSEESP